MLPSEAGSRPAGFNLLPRVTVGVAGIEPAAARIQAEMSTNDLHPDGQSGWNRTSMTVLPRHVDNHCPTLCRRSLELESNEPLSRFRRALSPGQLSRDGGTPPHEEASRTSAVGAGIEPAGGRVTICPVFQHTSPTIWATTSAALLQHHGRPPRASLHAVTPFSDCQRSRAHLRLGFRGPASKQLRAAPSHTCRRWATLESRARFGPGASVRNRTPTGGVRNRCSTNELRTREAEKCRTSPGKARTELE